MTVATAQTIFTYVVVLVVIIGGGAMLFALRGDATSGDMRALIGGFMGGALTWTFGREIAAGTAREAARQTLVTNGNPNGHAVP